MLAIGELLVIGLVGEGDPLVLAREVIVGVHRGVVELEGVRSSVGVGVGVGVAAGAGVDAAVGGAVGIAAESVAQAVRAMTESTDAAALIRDPARTGCWEVIMTMVVAGFETGTTSARSARARHEPLGQVWYRHPADVRRRSVRHSNDRDGSLQCA